MITLRCTYANGSITLHAERINDREVPRRIYTISDHKVILDGIDPGVVTHDITVLLSTPGDVYRMPTCAEQEADMAAQRSARTVQEVTYS